MTTQTLKGDMVFLTVLGRITHSFNWEPGMQPRQQISDKQLIFQQQCETEQRLRPQVTSFKSKLQRDTSNTELNYWSVLWPASVSLVTPQPVSVYTSRGSKLQVFTLTHTSITRLPGRKSALRIATGTQELNTTEVTKQVRPQKYR